MAYTLNVRLESEQQRVHLARLARELGFVREVYGETMPNVSAMIRAVASGELVVVRKSEWEKGGD